MKTKPKPTHGGARQGAGRPPINGIKMTKKEVWMMECQWEFCLSQGDSYSAGVRALVAAAMDKKK